jgi:hypothetical protein
MSDERRVAGGMKELAPKVPYRTKSGFLVR